VTVKKGAFAILGAGAIIAVIFGVLVLRETQQCSADAYRKQTAGLLRRWDDAVEIAGSTPRLTLSGPLSEMQNIQREASDLDISYCAILAHMRLTDYMDATIDSFLAFMEQEDDVEVQALFRRADDIFDDWEELVADIDQ
jgi:hypothetical protein